MPDSVCSFGPGRVNLIGEHTDYNDGLALPFAISQGVTVRGRRREGGEVIAVAADLQETDRFSLAEPAPRSGWRAFIRGAVAELHRAGYELRGARLEIAGTVPQGGGLSSSAALEVAVVLALLALADVTEPDRRELARICSRIENEWVGARTGLLDQLASLCGQQGSALRIDFRNLELQPVRLQLGEHRLVTLDSGEQHAHAASGYNRRREECAEASRNLGLSSLRDATMEMAARLPQPLAQRVRHVVSENLRVDATVAALEAGSLSRVGELLSASHASLRDCYEISTPAVERAVEALHDAGALGARLIGGGFGGNVLGLLPPGVQAPAAALEVRPGPGAQLLPDCER